MGGTGGRGRSVCGIALLILALLHVPLPLPDYHSLAHHDRCDGEVCDRHNHLLKWHGAPSGVEDASEQAVFHWHWVWPGREPARPDPDADGSGLPVLHADGDGWIEPTLEAAPPCLSPSRTPPAASDSGPTLPVDRFPPSDPFALRRCGPSSLRAPVARLAAPASVLQRWNC